MFGRLFTPLDASHADLTAASAATIASVLAAIIVCMHVVLTAVMLWWAVCMGWPGPQYRGGVTFRVFTEMMSQAHLTEMFGGVALLGIAGLLIRSVRFQIASSIVLGSAHMLLAAAVWLRTTASTGVGAYVGLGLFGYLLVYARSRLQWG